MMWRGESFLSIFVQMDIARDSLPHVVARKWTLPLKSFLSNTIVYIFCYGWRVLNKRTLNHVSGVAGLQDILFLDLQAPLFFFLGAQLHNLRARVFFLKMGLNDGGQTQLVNLFNYAKVKTPIL
jgi:hypothetical protein